MKGHVERVGGVHTIDREGEREGKRNGGRDREKEMEGERGK